MRPYTKSFCTLVAFVLFFSLVSSTTSAFVRHDVELDGGSALVDSFLLLESEEAVGGARITVGLEEDIDVINVSSQVGEATYSYDGGNLVLEVDSSVSRREHDIEVAWSKNRALTEPFSGLKRLDVGLFGFDGRKTNVVVEDTRLVSWNEPFLFKSQYSDGLLKFEGEGNLWLLGYLSDGGESTDNYYYSEDYDFSEAEEMFPIVEHVTGVSNPHEKIPVVVLSDDSYDDEFGSWSDGMYKSGGLVAIREKMDHIDMISTLLHETTHAFNDRALNWDSTGTAYYDEGTAQFTELLFSEVVGFPRAEVFGEAVDYTEDGSRYRIPSKSSSDELWDYYSEGDDWIVYWSPRNEEYEDSRTFGYALSELIIRNHVKNEGMDSLRDLYSELSEIGRRIEDPGEKARIMEDIVDMRPCYNESRTEFDSCLDRINNQTFDMEDIYLNHTFDARKEEIDIEERRVLEDPTLPGTLDLFVENTARVLDDFFRGVSLWISRML